MVFLVSLGVVPCLQSAACQRGSTSEGWLAAGWVTVEMTETSVSHPPAGQPRLVHMDSGQDPEKESGEWKTGPPTQGVEQTCMLSVLPHSVGQRRHHVSANSRSEKMHPNSSWQEVPNQVQTDIEKGREMMYSHLATCHVGQTFEKCSLRYLKFFPSPGPSQCRMSEGCLWKQFFLNISSLLAHLCGHN